MKLMVLGTALALALAGCSKHAHDDHGHGGHDDHGGGHGHDDHGGGHGHGHDGASEVITRWGATTQLFVEFPALAVGEESPFAAHLTELDGHAAVDRGVVTVELSGGGHPVERFEVDGPSVAGIFRPVVTPVAAGEREVTLRLESPVASEVHALGTLTVFPTRAAADAAAPDEAEDPGAISYLLEQQWRVPFQLARAEERPIRPNVPAFAHLALPSDAAVVIAAPRDGRVGAAGDDFPEVGAEIAKGTVLFRLNTTPREAGDPASLDLAVEQAGIRLAAARREVARLAPLVEQGVVARRRLDVARSAMSEAEAELRGARRRRASLGESQTVGGGDDALAVPTPLGGAIAEMMVAPGAWVTEGEPLARVVTRERLWLDVGVPEAYVGRLRTISGAWFELDGVAGVRDLPASALVAVGVEVDPETRTLPVRFAVDNARGELFPGMTTQAHLVTDTPHRAVAVPVDAVVDDGGTDVVYVQTGGEEFVRRAVRLGVRDGAFVEVVDGVAAGEWVVARGAWSVRLASMSTASIGHGHAH